jgi:phage tail sheath protein FI
MTYKTPGVYVKEISVFPPSVAEVETAIPAFIGYTEKAEKKGENLLNKPTRISSLLEFNAWFGGAYDITSVTVGVDSDNNYSVSSLTITKRFYMYDALRLFFDNGGGNCYIVSIGNYSTIVPNSRDILASDFTSGLDEIAKEDEPTILLFPDAVLLSGESSLYALQQSALSQCNSLQDRVAVFDLKESIGWEDSYKNFRNGIGINNLKYGTAYTPWLRTTYNKDVDFNIFKDHVVLKGTTTAVNLANITTDSDLNQLVVTADTALTDIDTVDTSVSTLSTATYPTIADRYKALRTAVVNATNANVGGKLKTLVEFLRQIAVEFPDWDTDLKGQNLKIDLEAYAKNQLSIVEELIALEKNTGVTGLTGVTTFPTDYDTYDNDVPGWLSKTVPNISANTEVYDTTGSLANLDIAKNIINGINENGLDDIFKGLNKFISSISEAADTHSKNAQKVLYEKHSIIGNMAESIKREFANVPPSGAVAGIYAYVDENRGVWKSPANVSLSFVSRPTKLITHNEQEDLNVDVNAGKSINAIRSFVGKGTLIWGARTLAGNDNEWRYISVRRFFNMVEESVKKSTGWAVFEPNDANTWTKVKGMIENYLIQKWRDGALQGAIPDEAFFVKIGLGQTMTYTDILEGRMNVEIGMAVVRPAEFIILKFSHKMIES